MKKLLATVATLVPLAAFGQGTVNFSNLSTALSSPPDRLVRFGQTVPVFFPCLGEGWAVVSNWGSCFSAPGLRASLYWGYSTNNDPSSFIEAITTSPATFKIDSTASPGTWFAKSATLGTLGNGIPGGSPGRLQVRVWDSLLATNAAVARNLLGTIGYGGTNGGFYGESAVFSYTPPTSATPTAMELTMQNLQGFKVEYFPYINGSISEFLPTILLHPRPAQNVLIGQRVPLSIYAWEPSPCTYRWYFNSTNLLSGFTNRFCVLTNAAVWDTGFYFCTVSNSAGTVTSETAYVNVVPGMGVDLVPVITLTGQVGLMYRLEYVTPYSAPNAWSQVADIMITNYPQLYIDISAIGNRSRLYRMVQLP